MSNEDAFTLKEKLIEIHQELKDHRQDWNEGQKEIDDRLDSLEEHRSIVVKITRGALWAVGIVIATIFFFKDILEIL